MGVRDTVSGGGLPAAAAAARRKNDLSEHTAAVQSDLGQARARPDLLQIDFEAARAIAITDQYFAPLD